MNNEDDDFIVDVDEEDMLQDVDVDIKDFNVNIDKDYEWVEHKSNFNEVLDEDNDSIDILNSEDFDSISEEEEEEGTDRIKKSKLRVLRKKTRTWLLLVQKGPTFI